MTQLSGSDVLVEVQIITGSRSSDYYVGDSFTYNITLRNIGNQTINSNFTVSVYNPSRDLLGSRTFNGIVLSQGQVSHLFPKKEQPLVKGNEEYDVFFFDTLGSYKIQISSSQYLLFWRSTETGGYTYQTPLYFYFDAMPRWEKLWRDRLTEWQSTNEKLSQQVLWLTFAVGWLTAINVAIAAYTVRRAKRDFIGALILAAIVFTLVMYYLSMARFPFFGS